MRPTRFRWKIVLLSLLPSGGVVLSFGLYFHALVSRVGMERVDREIYALAQSQLYGRHPAEHWSSFDQSLRFIHGDDSGSRMAVVVRGPQEELLYASPDCPAEVRRLLAPSSGPANGSGGTAEEGPSPAGRPAPLRDLPRDPRAAAEGARWVARLDLDHDGRVSRAEFDGPPDRFGDFDRDGDGYARAEEVPGFLPTPRRTRKPTFETVATPAGDWRVGIRGNELTTLLLGMDLAELRRDERRYRQTLLIVTPLALLGLAAGGWWLATRALRPVALITRTAEAITSRGLDRRIPATTADAELARLVQVINAMLDRLESSFLQAARFSADAAHELKTPLAVLQGQLEEGVRHAPDGSEEQQRYGVLSEEVRRLKAIVQKLLMLARADAGQLELQVEAVDLNLLLESALEDVGAMAPDVKVERDLAAGVRVLADPQLLGQVLSNLTGNAVKYLRPGGRIRCELRVGEGAARFTLRNTADPLPAADRARLFDRFYRGARARGGGPSGAGLGLSLAREIARAHAGDLVLEPDRDGMVAFTLTLPVAPPTGA
ncbi:MAG: HAMP domain-containing protein [Planctomycetes bacterium]|nr:HAMP domain-containing protein [Planctomycetota bacterium]